jgi:hypothetical protein
MVERRRLAVTAAVLVLGMGLTGGALAATEAAAPGAGDAAPAAGDQFADDAGATAVAPEPFPSAVPEGTKTWGGAWYSLSAQDKPGAATISDWSAAQHAGLSFNLRSPSGLEILSDLSVKLNSLSENSLETVIQQLSIRFAPSDWLSLVAGKQRLKWGTGKVFAAIDKGEQRADPLDRRAVLSGLSGVKAEILPLDWLGVSLLVMPETDLRWTRFAGRLDLTVADLGLDFGFGAIKYQYAPWKTQYSLSDPAGQDLGVALAAGADCQDRLDRVALIADGAWGAGDITIYGEGELRWGRETGYWLPGMVRAEDFGTASRDQLVVRGLAGLMWQLQLGLSRPASLILEYDFQGDGLDQAESAAFRDRWQAWQGLAAATPALAGQGVVPAGFYGTGSFRRHYAALALNGLALDRYLLARGSLIAGLDSGLLLGSLGLSYEFLKGVSVDLGWDAWGALLPESEQATELMLFGGRNRLSLSVSAGF